MGAVTVGLDLSLTAAGVAVIFDDDAPVVYTFGRDGITNMPLVEKSKAIEKIVNDISEVIRYAQPDLAAIEEMPYGAAGAGTLDRAWLWGRMVDELVWLGTPILKVNVSTVKMYATGKGNKVGKDEVMLAVARRYPDAPITNNNEADAFAIAAIGARAQGKPIEESLPQTHLRAMEKVKLP